MAVTAFGADYKNALEKAYTEVSKINFEGMNFRKDLGFDL
jgi:phosphoribosylamine--glycine ligase